ncbi:hypothetical protein, partial [Phenylobacterium sp.]|uniref:hypothetical protein n=1 Tax=Phenylobacterium sp. TaxID=1871053 RepID=UPI0035C8105C
MELLIERQGQLSVGDGLDEALGYSRRSERNRDSAEREPGDSHRNWYGDHAERNSLVVSAAREADQRK